MSQELANHIKERLRTRFKKRLNTLSAPLIEIFGISRKLAAVVVITNVLLIGLAVYWSIHSAPPKTITITAGAPGSSFHIYAERYQKALKEKGITLKILSSEGSLQNLERLNDPKSKVDVGFVQGGVTNQPDSNTLVSLGSITYAPLLIFYRSPEPVNLLSEFAGKRIAIGAPGSGTRSLALRLLALNDIKTNGTTKLEDYDGDEAADALMREQVDAIFLMSDSTSQQVISNLYRINVRLFDFAQADGYTRRIPYVNKLIMPQGLMDFGKNIPDHDVYLIGPTVELIAKPTLHPALSDLLSEAMKKTHGGAGVFKRQNEFPALTEHAFPISEEAVRYQQSGKRFIYNTTWIPFWLASLLSRVLVVFLPLIVVLIPGMRLIPAAIRWRMQMRITGWYRALLRLEREIPEDGEPVKCGQLLAQIKHIEIEVNKMKVPASFADQFYGLRGNVSSVRERLDQICAKPR